MSDKQGNGGPWHARLQSVVDSRPHLLCWHIVTFMATRFGDLYGSVTIPISTDSKNLKPIPIPNIYEIVLEVPWWLWYVCVRFKEESKFYTTITEKVDGARLYVFAGNRAETIAAVEGFVAMLRRTIKLPVGGLFLREISAEHMPWLPSEKPPPVFPLDGFVPADDALAPNLNENSADSYYWRR
ncbi:hypothetical protein AAVH_21474 [Aphelenchoides avenae]|nr:hypothetical protein AAVH_21474 [Aphelenchus avenae]